MPRMLALDTDLASKMLTQDEGDARYLQAATAAATYLPLTGGQLTGTLALQGTAANGYVLRSILQGEGANRFFLSTDGQLGWGDGVFGSPDTLLYRTGMATLSLQGHFLANANNFRDLGSTSYRWRKLYAADADLSGALATAGSLAVGQPLAAWSASYAVAQVGKHGSLASWNGGSTGGTRFGHNTYTDGSFVDRALQTGPASRILCDSSGNVTIQNAGSVGQGASHTLGNRLSVAANGQTQLSPDAGVAAVTIGGTAQPKITVAASAPSSPMTGDLWLW